MSLESRAARARRSLQASVAGVAPVGMPAVVGRQRASLFTSLVAVAAMTLLLVGVASAMPSLFEPDRVGNGQSSTPDPDGGLIGVEPDDKESDGELVDLEPNVGDAPVRQTNSESDSPAPWTKFYGDAEPGTTVSAVSDWGAADLVVDGRAEFSLKLEFDPLPTAGVAFPILVTVGDTVYEFRFTSFWSPDEVVATANQLYGMSDDADAYEKFFGTAPPGEVVSAESPYGSAGTTSGDNGGWDLKLWFDDLPANEPFEVTIGIGDETFTFGFVSTYEPQSWPLSISQYNTQSDSAEPWVKFLGTAPVGTVVSAQSPYGSQSVTVGDSGEVFLKLWFASLPPAGQQFTVSVKVDGAPFGSYPFTSYYAAPAAGGDDGGESVSVDQYNTDSDSADPWVKFIVGGPVGTQVQIISSYGSMSRTLEATEEYVKLWFSSLPPAGVEFPVTVKIDGDVWGTYPFTSWYDPAGVSISVDQYNTDSDSADPWVKFVVGGPVGTQVQIISSYGSMSRTLEATEEYVKLWFSSLPPAGVEFPVTVKIDGDVWGTYPFTSWYEEPAVPIPKTANNTYGTSSEAFDIYYGTAPEGTNVSITSPYGSGATTADAAGDWSKQVSFVGAPLDDPFTVTVTVGGEVFTFGMIVTG